MYVVQKCTTNSINQTTKKNMNFQEFREIESTRDDLAAFDEIVQESNKGEDGEYAIAYDRYAEMYASRFPNFVGILQVENDCGKHEAIAIINGKVIYQRSAVFGGKCKVEINIVPEKEFLGFGEAGEAIEFERSENIFLIHAEGNPQSPFVFHFENEAREFSEFLIRFRIESTLNQLLE